MGKNQHGYAVGGARVKRTLVGPAKNLTMLGSYCEITFVGKCGRLEINGSGNIVLIEEVADIVLYGSNNTVKFVRGRGGKQPKMLNVGDKNDITQIPSLPKTKRK